MSQISGKILGGSFRQEKGLRLRRESMILPGAACINGRSYARRLVFTDTMIIAVASAAPLAVLMSGAELGEADGDLFGRTLALGVTVALFWSFSLVLFRTRSTGRIAVGMQEYKFMVGATAVVAGTLALVAVLTDNHDFKLFVVLSLPAGLSALLMDRWLWRCWLIKQRQKGFALSNVLVYGQAKDAPYVIRQISKQSGPAYRVVAVLLEGTPSKNERQLVQAADPTLPISFATQELETEVARYGADAVVVAGPLHGGTGALQELGWRLEKTKANLIVVSSLMNVASRRVRTSPVDGMPLMHVDLARFSGWRFWVKRGFDLVFAALALLAISPVLLTIALLIRLDGPGKIFFLQERAGQDGQPFKMFKFRTMVHNAEEQLAELEAMNEGAGPLFKLKDDPRITRIGKLLRKHSLDELPQFLNVLRGEMSVVGPRPPLFKEVQQYQGKDHRRLYLKPGVTGLWQVSGRSNLDWDESIRLDLYYAENWTVMSDLRIVWRTFKVMIKPDGAY